MKNKPPLYSLLEDHQSKKFGIITENEQFDAEEWKIFCEIFFDKKLKINQDLEKQFAEYKEEYGFEDLNLEKMGVEVSEIKAEIAEKLIGYKKSILFSIPKQMSFSFPEEIFDESLNAKKKILNKNSKYKQPLIEIKLNKFEGNNRIPDLDNVLKSQAAMVKTIGINTINIFDHWKILGGHEAIQQLANTTNDMIKKTAKFMIEIHPFQEISETVEIAQKAARNMIESQSFQQLAKSHEMMGKAMVETGQEIAKSHQMMAKAVVESVGNHSLRNLKYIPENFTQLKS